MTEQNLFTEQDLFSVKICDEYGCETHRVYEVLLPDGSIIRKPDIPSLVPVEEPSDDDLAFPVEADVFGEIFEIRLLMQNHVSWRRPVNKLVFYGKGRTNRLFTKDDLDRRSRPPEPGTVRSRLNA